MASMAAAAKRNIADTADADDEDDEPIMIQCTPRLSTPIYRCYNVTSMACGIDS
jgi:hypothetical protein